MKRIILLCLSFILSTVIYAQEEHMTFKNIPMTGSMSTFISKMEAAGFTLIEQEGNIAIMKGTFAGYSDCQIIIGGTPKTKTVWKVVAKLPDQQSWSSIKSRYKDFKSRYTDKYGTPESSFEFFSDSYYEGDGYELSAIALEKGYYMTFWKIELGNIAVSIDASKNTKGWIELGYEDKAGIELKEKETSAIVDEDI